MEVRKYIVGLVAVVLLIWGPHDRLGYLILIPLGVWFLLGWLWQDRHPQSDPELNDARMEVIKPIAISTAATIAICYLLVPQYAKLQISLNGKEAKAFVVTVETVERDNIERAWTADLINFTFRTEDGYVFAGVNDANSSATTDLIGRSDAAGKYPDAKVQYVRSNPAWHRLKSQGNDQSSPSNIVFDITFTMVMVVVPIAFAYWYVYSSLFCRLHGNRFERPREKR